MWWEKKLALVGAVLFRGDWPPRPEEYAFLETAGIHSEPDPHNTPEKWLLHLTHPAWGKADLFYKDNLPLPPRELFEHERLPKSERDAAISCKSQIGLRMEPVRGHILRDRKLMLRFFRAIMADDGVIAMDHTAQNVWTRQALDDELSHDADLDVQGIYSIHVVSGSNREAYWVHTHGLFEAGNFDFDVFEPSESARFNMQDLFRAIAFHILEGRLTAAAPSFQLMSPKGSIRMVDMESFLRNTDASRRAALAPDVDQFHRRSHSVLCEPEASGLGRIFGAKTLRPASLLTTESPQNPMFGFSNSASDLMAQRAKGTYPLLRALHQEFAEFEFPCLVKLGYRTDGGSATDREHMWFAVHTLNEDSIDATLANRPYKVSSLREGDRGYHSIDLITDWVIMTPFGHINPRSSNAARVVRSKADEIRQMMKQHR